MLEEPSEEVQSTEYNQELNNPSSQETEETSIDLEEIFTEKSKRKKTSKKNRAEKELADKQGTSKFFDDFPSTSKRTRTQTKPFIEQQYEEEVKKKEAKTKSKSPAFSEKLY